MASALQQVLEAFEQSGKPILLVQLAAQVGRPVGVVEGMLEHWVRKGKLRVSSGHGECGSCAKEGDCVYVLDMPKTYEVVREDLIGLDEVGVVCGFEEVKPFPLKRGRALGGGNQRSLGELASGNIDFWMLNEPGGFETRPYEGNVRPTGWSWEPLSKEICFRQGGCLARAEGIPSLGSPSTSLGTSCRLLGKLARNDN